MSNLKSKINSNAKFHLCGYSFEMHLFAPRLFHCISKSPIIKFRLPKSGFRFSDDSKEIADSMFKLKFMLNVSNEILYYIDNIWLLKTSHKGDIVYVAYAIYDISKEPMLNLDPKNNIPIDSVGIAVVVCETESNVENTLLSLMEKIQNMEEFPHYS